MDGSHSGRLAGSHRDSSRDVVDQDAEKCRSSQQKSSAPTLCVGRTAKGDEAEKVKEQPPILKYIKTQVRKLQVPVTVHREQSVKREKTNKMQQSDIYYQLLSQHVSGIITPIFGRTKTVLLHVVYCSGSAGCGW